MCSVFLMVVASSYSTSEYFNRGILVRYSYFLGEVPRTIYFLLLVVLHEYIITAAYASHIQLCQLFIAWKIL